MENASKALIMAAEILIGVMVISIGVYLFTTLGQYSADTTAEIEEYQLEQYNNQFLKYYGYSTTETGSTERIRCTIHDIVGLANLASKINRQNGFTGTQDYADNSEYIQIDVKTSTGETKTHLEAMDQKQLIELIQKNDVLETNEIGVTEAKVKYFKATEYHIRRFYKKS